MCELTKDSSLLVTTKHLVEDTPMHTFKTFVCLHCGEMITVAQYCGNRFCVVCGSYKRKRIQSRLKHIFSLVKQDYEYRLKFLTLTIGNQKEIKPAVKHLCHSFSKFRNSKEWRQKVLGGIYVIEVTGSPGAWHVHIHAIVLAKYYDVYQISKTWKKYSGGKIVDIRIARTNTLSTYLSKYISKSSVKSEYLNHVSSEMKSIRLINPFGNFIGYAKSFKKRPTICKQCGHSFWQLYEECTAWIRNGNKNRIVTYANPNSS